MQSYVQRATDYLRDPYLVRRIQKAFGVTQIATPTENDSRKGRSPHPPSQETDGSSSTTFTDSNSSSESPNGGSGLMNGSIEWLASKAKVRHRLKPPASTPAPPKGPQTLSESKGTLQKEIIVETIPVFDIYFRLATELGYEPFYVIFLSFMFWNIDGLLARHMVLLWCTSMYVGQASKALFKWKRPASPPALRLEHNPNLETEYGFPSTHAIVSTTIPFYFLFSCFGRYEFPLWLGVIIAFTWCISVCFSRIYLGVHTIMDIIGGIVISLVILLMMVPVIDHLDNFVLHSQIYGAVLAFLIVVFLLYIYPIQPDKWTMDRGDTAAILGVGLGVWWGYYLHGPYPEDLTPGPFIIVMPSLHVIGQSLVRFVVGILLILPTRFVMKLLCFKLLPAIMPTHGVQEVVHRPLVELPYKIITYSVLGINCIHFVPHVFKLINISRWDSI